MLRERMRSESGTLVTVPVNTPGASLSASSDNVAGVGALGLAAAWTDGRMPNPSRTRPIPKPRIRIVVPSLNGRTEGHRAVPRSRSEGATTATVICNIRPRREAKVPCGERKRNEGPTVNRGSPPLVRPASRCSRPPGSCIRRSAHPDRAVLRPGTGPARACCAGCANRPRPKRLRRPSPPP